MSIFGQTSLRPSSGKKTPGATSLAPGAPGAPGAPSAPAPQGTATAGGAPATGKAITQAEVRR